MLLLLMLISRTLHEFSFFVFLSRAVLAANRPLYFRICLILILLLLTGRLMSIPSTPTVTGPL